MLEQTNCRNKKKTPSMITFTLKIHRNAQIHPDFQKRIPSFQTHNSQYSVPIATHDTLEDEYDYSRCISPIDRCKCRGFKSVGKLRNKETKPDSRALLFRSFGSFFVQSKADSWFN